MGDPFENVILINRHRVAKSISSWREFDDAMQMVWQYHPTMDNERMTLPYLLHHLAQQIYMPSQQIVYPAVAAGSW